MLSNLTPAPHPNLLPKKEVTVGDRDKGNRAKRNQRWPPLPLGEGWGEGSFSRPNLLLDHFAQRPNE
jgi:hypothetical protein